MKNMLGTRTRFALIAGIGIAAAGLVLTDNATADVARPGAEPVFMNTCLTKTPDATKTMGPNVNSVSSASNGGTYGTATLACKAWVVDINVPSNSSGSPGWEKTIGFTGMGPMWGAANKAACEATVLTEFLYKKTMTATSFTRIAGGTLKGEWTDGDMFPCMLVAQSGYVPFPAVSPPAAGTTVYKVTRAIKEGTVYKAVQIGAQHGAPVPN